MPASKGRGTAKKRTHNLGGCATCRRRHVKCDHARPTCATCRKAGLDCGGYPSQIRWASMSYAPSRPPDEGRSSSCSNQRTSIIPRLLMDCRADYTVEVTRRNHAEVAAQDQLLPPLELAQSNDSQYAVQQDGSNNVAIEEVALNHTPASMSVGISNTTRTATGSESTSLLPQESDLFNHSSVGSMSDLESLFESSNGLIWNDLFDTTFDMSMPLVQDQLYDPSYNDPLSLLAHVAHQPQNHGINTQSFDCLITASQSHEKQNMSAINASSFDAQPPPYAPTELDEAQVLRDAQYLLKHFRSYLVPQFGPLPMSCKSPWETLNWSNAVATHAELTWLQGSNVKHANKANLFALLGCSAHMIAKAPPFPNELDHIKSMQILEYVSKRAKKHMQESLRLETSGDGKAKYKDQLMAIFSLVALAVSCLGQLSTHTLG